MAESTSSGGVSLGTVVFIIFLVLKLTDHIDWSWWWVTAPLWGGLVLILGIVAIVATIKIGIRICTHPK